MSDHRARARHLIWVALSQLAQVIVVGRLWVCGRVPAEPNVDETLSSYVGRHAILGWPGALRAERLIDRGFKLLGYPPGHCRRNIERACPEKEGT